MKDNGRLSVSVIEGQIRSAHRVSAVDGHGRMEVSGRRATVPRRAHHLARGDEMAESTPPRDAPRTCDFCGRSIPRNAKRKYTFRYADGTRAPMHKKCLDFMEGRIDGTAWDIKGGF